MSDEQQNLEALRHSAAHLLAAAVLELYPDAKPTIGPAIKNGFYYDFDFGADRIGDEDLQKIEKKMREILPTWNSVESIDETIDSAQSRYLENQYKKELVQEIAGRGEKITSYRMGKFTDLCRGGHVESPARDINPDGFRLTHLAGAYWRGDEKNQMLTRIYGLAFPTKEELEAEAAQIEEAKKRDHKKLGPQLDLFTFSELVGPGLPLWTPKGTILRQILDDYVWQLRRARGYERVEIPHITKKALYEQSGHWEKFQDALFRITTREGHEFAMKPMNCPHHTQIYKRRQFSYRDLPQRYANTTMVYRDEQTGELGGLTRVRAITQDDAHVFCRKTQVREEFLAIWDIVDAFYAAVGFTALSVRLSTRDPANPQAYLGDEKLWNEAERTLKDLTKRRGTTAIIAEGEAAFYGPKLDFIAEDSLGRKWQVATIQLDMNLPERFDLTCINEKGAQERIVMIHAAIMGSLERFLAILIEHTAGAFPVWLTPVQVLVLPVAERHDEKAAAIRDRLIASGIRAETVEADETLGRRIRDAELQKIPYIAVIGDKEATDSLAIRRRGKKEQEALTLNGLIEEIRKAKPVA